MMRKALIVVALGGVSALRLNNKTKAFPDVATQKEVDATRARLEELDVNLEQLLKNGSMAHTKPALAIKLFAGNLESVLNETKAMKPADAMKKLLAAKEGVAGLVADISHQQESLMKETVEQQEGLLLGSLLTHKADSMSNQLNIVKQADFVGLDVAKALLASNDTKTPLYVQAAQFLDTHKHVSGKIVQVERREALAASFDKRAQDMEKVSEHQVKQQTKRIAALEKLASKGGKNTKRVQVMLKRAMHEAKKSAAESKYNIETMKEAAKAIRAGDVKGLDRARAALQKSLQSLTDKNAGMVVFLQQGNAVLEKDCPYCAAQCVEKCHNKGEPYVSCLTECADAGKA